MFRTRIVSAAFALVLAGAGAVLAVQPASAASTYITICNSSLSFTTIQPNHGQGVLQPGWCSGTMYNGDNGVRVDTDYSGSSHSYKINPVGAPVGPCHTNSDNHSSDPPNYATVYYQNFDHGNCTN
jgi:hypothetical protein